MDLRKWNSLYDQLLAYAPQAVEWYPPVPPFYTAYKGALYGWDLYFEALVQGYAGLPVDYVRNSVQLFLDHQDSEGHIPRSIRYGTVVFAKHTDHMQPFLCQTLLSCMHRGLPPAWLAGRWEQIKAYLDYWLDHEDRRGAGLSVWKWTGATGMDNLYERAGTWEGEHFFCEGVDLNAYLVRECQACAVLAGMIDRADDAAHYTARAEARAEAMRRWLWHEEDGIFYDFHATRQTPINVKHAGTFAALWAGVASPAQAERLVREHLLNPQEFWREWPIPVLAASEPGYVCGFLPGNRTDCCSWRAHTWTPTNYYTFQGLRRYGFIEEARLLAERSWQLFLRGPFSEYYVTEGGVGTGRKPFYGWTALFLFMSKELELGVDPTAMAAIDLTFTAMRDWIAHASVGGKQ